MLGTLAMAMFSVCRVVFRVLSIKRRFDIPWADRIAAQKASIHHWTHFTWFVNTSMEYTV